MKNLMKKTISIEKCEETLNKIRNLREAIIDVLQYGDGVVDVGIVPPESIEDFRDCFEQYSVCLENMSEAIFEFVKFIRNYATIGIKFREIIIQEEQLLADITQKVCDYKLNMKRVEIGLRCATGTVDYWYSQRWLNGKSDFNGSEWLHNLKNYNVKYYYQ